MSWPNSAEGQRPPRAIKGEELPFPDHLSLSLSGTHTSGAPGAPERVGVSQPHGNLKNVKYKSILGINQEKKKKTFEFFLSPVDMSKDRPLEKKKFERIFPKSSGHVQRQTTGEKKNPTVSSWDTV